MKSLTSEQRRLIFDYCLKVTSSEENQEAQGLIKTSSGANKLHERLSRVLKPLNCLHCEHCLDELTEKTLIRLTDTASANQEKLNKLLESEQKQQHSKFHLWRGAGELLATAAMIVLFAGVMMPPLRYARQKSLQQKCQMHMSQIGTGVNQYSADNAGAIAFGNPKGQPWWKVGYQGKENHSNTRHVWVLVKQGYVNPQSFICPGRPTKTATITAGQVSKYNDFANKDHIHYSIRIGCKRPNGVLASDSNPIFEDIDSNAAGFKIDVNERLLNLNSRNHNRRGQNVLNFDGSVNFMRSRHIGISKDDIFTLQNVRTYKGSEFPNCETDAFLAP
jgi:hypothetical protein